MKLLAITFAFASVLCGGPAHADCKQWFDALEKSSRQPRFAHYEVSGPEQPLTGKPDTVCIGNVCWQRAGGAYKRIEAEEADALFFAELRAEAKQDTARCTHTGSGTYRGNTVTKIRFGSPLLPEQYSATIWVDRRTGLVVYMDTGELGGHAIVYGDAVNEPVAGK